MHAEPIRTVLDRLPGHRKTGEGQFEARCPAHEDSRASLSVGVGQGDRVLLKCHAGCDTNEVLRAMELAHSDLFPPKPVERRIVATYPYTDEKGAPLFEVLRYEPKDFRQRHRGPNGEWVWKMNGVRRVLYRLPELVAASAKGAEVWVVEGERDVETLRKAGLTATCNPGGAGKWRPEYAAAFKGASAVYVIPDNDDPGRAHAQAVATALADVVPVVKVVPLPAVAKDVTEWVGHGATAAQLAALAAKVPPSKAAVNRVPEQAVPLLPTPSGNVLPTPVRSGSRTSSNQPVVRGSAALRAEPPPEAVRGGVAASEAPNHLPWRDLDDYLAWTDTLPDPTWLIPELVPDAGPVEFAAAPNAGKTFLALVVAKAAALAGRPVFLVLEEGGAKTTGKRFRNLAFPPGLPVMVLHQHGVSLAEHAHTLAAQLAEGVDGPAPVVVLDPFASVFRGNENDTEQMAAAVELLRVIQRADPRALLVVPHHTSKAGEKGEVGEAMYSSRGGSSLPAWADVVLVLKHVKTPKGSGRVEFDALMAKNRDGERDYTIRIAIELGAGEVTFTPIAEARQQAKASDLRERVIAFVGATTGLLTKNAICEGVKGTKTEKLKLIDALTNEGVFVNDGAGWSIAPKAAADA